MAARLIIVVFVAFVFNACRNDDVWLQKTKSLDSLGGALSAMNKQLSEIDTATLSRVLLRHSYYMEFVSRNVTDTLSKNEADDLGMFNAAGQKLKAFQSNRKQLLLRADALNAQLGLLSADVRTRKISEPNLNEAFKHESREAKSLIEMALIQQKVFHSAMQNFTNALRGTENLIRKRNNGELPQIIKDTLQL